MHIPASVFQSRRHSSRARNILGARAPAAAAVRLSLKNVCGEAVVYKSFDLDGFLKQVRGRVVFTEELSDSVNYYCTADLPYSVTVNGHRINLHICVRADSVKAGSPIIFGGY